MMRRSMRCLCAATSHRICMLHFAITGADLAENLGRTHTKKREILYVVDIYRQY